MRSAAASAALLLLCAGLLFTEVHAGEVDAIRIFSYDRGATNCVLGARNFTYVIGSDVQLWWWNRDNRNTKTWGEYSNKLQLVLWKNMSNLAWQDGSRIQAPSALVINGDLTAFGFDDEWNQFRKLYDNDDSNTYRTFLGLGNHDYQNNILDCVDGGVDATTCTRRSVQVLRQTLAGVTVNSATRSFARFPGPLNKQLSAHVNAFDWGSMAYSWSEGSYHFIMLNNHPAFTVDLPSYSVAGSVIVTPSYDFLAKELSKGVATGRKNVLFIHDVDENWKPANDTRFMSMLTSNNVVAVFAGHIHEVAGSDDIDLAPGVPLFHSGSSEYYTSLVADFGEDALRVQVFNSSTGNVLDFRSVNTSPLRCMPAKASQPPVAVECPPNWTRDGTTCRAPCLPDFSLSGGVCRRTGCGRWGDQNLALCYQKCPKKYPNGVGPVCWADCSGQGATTVGPLCWYNGCLNGLEKQAGLCYPKCKDGYYGVGPVCWQRCPSGYTDDGALCRRNAHIYGKGCCCTLFGCCHNCKKGYTDDGCTCRRNVHIFAKSSYGRGVGKPALRATTRGSQGRGAGVPLFARYNQDHYTLPSTPAAAS